MPVFHISTVVWFEISMTILAQRIAFGQDRYEMSGIQGGILSLLESATLAPETDCLEILHLHQA